MELQYSSKYNPIGQKGCYFISLGVWAEELSGKKLKKAQVLDTYVNAVHSGVMGTNCFIRYPDSVLNLFLKELGSNNKVVYVGRWSIINGTSYVDGFGPKDIDFSIQRYKTPSGFHFRNAGFDPGPRFKREPEINGKRYFKVIK